MASRKTLWNLQKSLRIYVALVSFGHNQKNLSENDGKVIEEEDHQQLMGFQISPKYHFPGCCRTLGDEWYVWPAKKHAVSATQMKTFLALQSCQNEHTISLATVYLQRMQRPKAMDYM